MNKNNFVNKDQEGKLHNSLCITVLQQCGTYCFFNAQFFKLVQLVLQLGLQRLFPGLECHPDVLLKAPG